MANSTIPNSNSSSSTGTVGKGSQITTGTLDSNGCSRVGNIATASGRIHTMTNQDAGTHTWFVIPEGFRPKHQIRCFSYMAISNEGWFPIIATVNTDGTVVISYTSSKQCNQVGFAATYVI